MNSQPADLPVFQRRFEIGRRGGERVEGLAAVGILNVDAVVVKLDPNAHGVLHSCAAPMPDRIGEQLFQNEVQFEFHFIAESMLAAESYGFGYQALKLSQAPVEDNFRFGQNCLIVPHWGWRFQPVVRAPGWRGILPRTRSSSSLLDQR
jgi:hypothetical protein